MSPPPLKITTQLVNRLISPTLGANVTKGGGGGCPVVVTVVVTPVCRATRYLPSVTIRSTFPLPGMVGSDPIVGGGVRLHSGFPNPHDACRP
jgi:hypothetical protein